MAEIKLPTVKVVKALTRLARLASNSVLIDSYLVAALRSQLKAEEVEFLDAKLKESRERLDELLDVIEESLND